MTLRHSASMAVLAVALAGAGGALAAEAAAPTSANPDSVQLTEIVVHGEKRDTTALRTPAQVSVFGDQQIKQDAIQRPEDFLHMTANVTFFDDNAQEAQVAIRGQGAARTADQSVAFVVDGVQLTNQKLFDNNLFDISQIEVFKGPQSTIYGRNASAGAIVITTKMPTDTPAGEVYVGYGSFNTAFADAAYSGPIAPGLKFRLSTSVGRTDGPYQDVTTRTTVRAHQDIAGRLTLQYDPSDTLRLVLRLSALHSTGDGLAYNAQFVGLPIGGVPVPAADANQTNIPFVTAIRGQGNRTIYDGNLTIEKNFGFAKLTSVTDYSYLSALEYAGDLIPYNSVSVTHQEGTQSDYVVNRSFSEDIRLASPSTGWFRWMVGGYYLHLDKPQTILLGVNDALVAVPANFGLQPPGSINPTISIVDDIVKDRDYAVYGNVQFDLIPNLELNIAGRYDIEEKSDRELAPDAINPLTGLNYNLCVATLSVPLSQCYEKATFYRFTPKVSLTYTTPLGSVFASWGTGFKSGGFNPIGTRAATVAAAIAAGQPTNDIYVQDNFKTETSETYEVGVKGRFFGRRLAVNLSGYWTQIKNEQEFVFFPTAGIQAIESIDRVDIKGFDADFTALLPYGVTLSGAYGYNDGVIKAFSPNPSYVGNVAPLALKYTVDLSASKSFELSNGFTLTPRVEYQRQGPIFWNSANTPGTERYPVDLMNFSVALRRDNWEVTVWGKNALDERYNEEYVPLIGILAVLYKADPASFGVTADVHF